MGYSHKIDVNLSSLDHAMQYGSDGKPVIRTAASNGQLDAFGRLRISNPFTLFDSTHKYEDNGEWNHVITGTGSVTHLPNVSSIALEVGTTSGDEIIRETYKVFQYQPGKGLLNLNTFKMHPAEANLRQRVGHFGAENGVYLEQDGLSTVNWVLRSFSSGSIVNNKAEKGNADPDLNWNVDNFDGNGPSGITLDLTKTQIMWSDIEWLGVGSIRCGFIIDGSYHMAHEFKHANRIDDVYMTSGTLPLRYEITNTGTTTGTPTLQQTCSTVISEGGFEKKSIVHWGRMATAKGTVGTAFEPLISIRLNSSYLDAVVLPIHFNILPTTLGDMEVIITKNPELTNATWAETHLDGSAYKHVDVDIGANIIANGHIISTQFASSTNQASGVTSDTDEEFNPSYQLGRTIGGVSDVYTIAARSLTGTTSVIASFGFLDLT